MGLKAFLELLRPEADKQAAFKNIVEMEMERARAVFNASLKQSALTIQMALSGGPCPRCKREWKQVDVNNPFALFTYYKPQCRCYITCWYCGHMNYEELEAGIDYKECPRCGADVKNPHQLFVTSPKDGEKSPRYVPKVSAHNDPRRWDMTGER